MASVFLSLGTNLGDKEDNLLQAIQKIEEQTGDVISRSAFYITAPWGFDSVNSFLNAAIEITTLLSPLELLDRTQSIEKEMGRKTKSENQNYSDRIIDIDILLYEDLVFEDSRLQLPHPFMTERLFVMEPLAEIAADIVHPVLKQPFSVILEELQSKK